MEAYSKLSKVRWSAYRPLKLPKIISSLENEESAEILMEYAGESLEELSMREDFMQKIKESPQNYLLLFKSILKQLRLIH